MASSEKKKRKSSGKFPPNPKQWPAEKNGINFRARFGMGGDEPLRPFERMLDGVEVVATLDSLAEFVGERDLLKLLGVHRRKWSGMTIPCDGEHIVVMNPTHHPHRQNATLMEEFFHILLRHRPSRVFSCPETGLVRRSFKKEIEEEAYHSAAAALVPYKAMRGMVERGADTRDIAGHFEVSQDLAGFRLKICKLWRRTQQN